MISALRFAYDVNIGNEVLVEKYGQLEAAKVKSISTFTMQGYQFFQSTVLCFNKHNVLNNILILVTLMFLCNSNIK